MNDQEFLDILAEHRDELGIDEGGRVRTLKTHTLNLESGGKVVYRTIDPIELVHYKQYGVAVLWTSALESLGLDSDWITAIDDKNNTNSYVANKRAALLSTLRLNLEIAIRHFMTEFKLRNESVLIERIVNELKTPRIPEDYILKEVMRLVGSGELVMVRSEEMKGLEVM